MQFEAVACRLFLHYSYTLAQKASNYGIFCFYDKNKQNQAIYKIVSKIETGYYTDPACSDFHIKMRHNNKSSFGYSFSEMNFFTREFTENDNSKPRTYTAKFYLSNDEKPLVSAIQLFGWAASDFEP